MKQIMLIRAVAIAGLLVILAALMSAGTPIRLSFRDTTIVGGSALSYPLYVDSSLTGYAVSAYQIQFTYNTSAFSFTGATSSGCIDSAWGAPMVNEISPGTVRISGAGSVNLAGVGKLAILQFTSKILSYNSSSPFTFQSSLFNEGTPTSNNYRSGTVFMKATPTVTVSPDTWLATKGDTRQFTVSGGRVPYTWGSTVPSVATIDAAGLLTAISAGFTRVYAADSAGIVDTTNLVEVRAFRLSFRDTSRYQGQTLDLPIYTTDLTGLGVISGQFTVTFDNSKWTVQSVLEAGTLLAPVSPVTYSVGPGSVSVSFAGTTPLTGSGVLLYLRLKASSINYGGSTFGFQNNVQFNQNVIANIGTGYITVQPLATIIVNPNYQQILVAGDSLQFTASGGTKPYTWSVSDPLRASISSSGLFKAKKSGTVTVKAQDSVGGIGISGNVVLYDFRVNVPDTSFIPTSFVEVPLYITANASGFVSYQVTLSYSTNTYVKLVDIVSTGTLSTGFTIAPSYGNGTAKFAAAGVTSVTSGGILIKLKFAVPDSTPRPSTSYITITSVIFDEGTPLALTKNGSFQIANTSVFSNSPGAVSLHAKVGQQDSAVITVFNKGTANLTSTIGVIGPSIFTRSPTNINVIPGDSAKVKVYYQPLSQGVATATIRFNTNDPYHSTVDVAVTGTTPYPILGFDVPSVNFSTVTVGQYKDLTTTISNTGNDTLKITSISSTSANFTARPAIGTIPPGQSLVDTLRFAPSVAGFVWGRISVTSNSLKSPDTIGVSGTGTTFFPIMAFSISNINFGSVKVGSFKDTAVTITNNGTDTLRISNITASNSVFTGRPTKENVPPGQSFTDTLRFTPTSIGVFTGRIFVASNALKNPDTIIVSGTGIISNGIKDVSIVPTSFVLEQNFPNPFNPSTAIRYAVPFNSNIRLTIFNTLCQRITELVNQQQNTGWYEIVWNAKVASGLYFYRIDAVSTSDPNQRFTKLKKMILLK